MNSKAEDLSRGESEQNRLRYPFAVLKDIRSRLSEDMLRASVDGSRLAQLLGSATVLESVSDWATEMELGADGFDNRTSSRRYARLQEHLQAAGREIAMACRALGESIDLK